MKLLLHFCLMAFVALVTGRSFVKKDGASLDVKLTSTGNTAMQAIVTNNGSFDLNLLHIGSLLDTDRPVTKVTLFSDNSSIPSGGMRIDTGSRRTDFSPESFTKVVTGQSITVDFDAATTYDLSAGGTFTAQAIGQFRYTKVDSTTVGPSPISYQSNAIEINVEASAIPKLQKRSFHSSCKAWQRNYIEMSMQACYDFTFSAMTELEGNDITDRINEYFFMPDENIMQAAHDRLTAINTECYTPYTGEGEIQIVCEDTKGQCTERVQAYTLDSDIIICPDAWDLPSIALECREVDFAGLMIHELSRNPGIYLPVTEEPCNGYAEVSTCGPTLRALTNADTYMYFSQASYWNCPRPSEQLFDPEQTQKAAALDPEETKV